MDLGFVDEVNEIGFNEDAVSFEKPTFENIIPKEGCFLGLDISEESTGVCLIINGNRRAYNISLSDEWKSLENDCFREAKIRKVLAKKLMSLVGRLNFSKVFIEDVYVGENPKTIRLLYALNTVIDDLILEGYIKCDEFRRIQNRMWKSWLWTLDSSGDFKGFNDKVKIQECLKMVGVEETGKGFQDRLDATGMIVGYFLCEDKIKETDRKKEIKKVSWSDVEVVYEPDTEFIYEDNAWIEGDDVIFFSYREKVGKKYIIEKLTENPSKVFISDDLMTLGRLGNDLDLPIINGGGYLGFWIKESKRKKYKEV